MSSAVSMLENVPLFSGLSAEELTTIEAHGVIRSHRKNTIIIHKGDETDSLYLILAGRVKVFLADETGKEIILNTQTAGDHLGELALVRESPRTSSVMTTEDSKFLVLSKSAFQECLSRHPNIAFNLIGALAERISELSDNVSSLALLDVYGRVAKVLVERSTEQDGERATERLTQQDIANMVGASREMVSKIFKDLKAGGYISVEDQRVILHRKLPSRW